jgi:hypothetical protein
LLRQLTINNNSRNFLPKSNEKREKPQMKSAKTSVVNRRSK